MMSTRSMAVPPTSQGADTIAQLLRQYGCGPIQFAGTDNAFYERHLVFDNVIELTTTAESRGQHGPGTAPRQ
jgi:starch phosphorylase